MEEAALMKREEIDQKISDVALKAQNSPEIANLAGQLDFMKPDTLMSFGQAPAEEISRFADRILGTINQSYVEDSGDILKHLASIMKKVDLKDFEETKRGLLSILFKKVADSVDQLLSKYRTMDTEISKIYVQIKGYQSEIDRNNKILDELFDKNLFYFEDLEKYIAAGRMALERVNADLMPALEQKAASGQEMDVISLQNARQALEMLDNRVHDLELARMVALQTIPQIKLIQNGNYNLLRKIDSAFIITIPVFKTGMIQAITIKRQKIQAEALKALDETTNEMLLRNAQNIAQQSVDIARLSGGTSVKVETLEQTYQTIMQGIEDTRAIEDSNKKLREESRARLQKLQEDMERRRMQL